jgi:predicted dehydrogenase
LANGTLVRLTTNFYVGHHSKQNGIEFHGDLGSLHLPTWHDFNTLIEFTEFGGQYESVPLIKEGYKGTEWGRAVLDMAEAIAEGRPHRATGEHAAHVVEILCAAAESVEKGQPVEIHSSFTPPEMMDWAK